MDSLSPAQIDDFMQRDMRSPTPLAPSTPDDAHHVSYRPLERMIEGPLADKPPSAGLGSTR